MEIRHLRYFIAIAEARGFARAESILHVSQPALSRQIRDLEEELGVTLFDRTSHGAHLTPAGKSFLEDARQVLVHIEQAKTRARDVYEGGIDRLTIAIVDPFSWNDVFTRSVNAFRNQNPRSRLSVVIMTSRAQFAGIMDGRISAGIIHGQSQYAPEFQSVEILKTKLVAAVSCTSRFARNPPKRLAELAGQDFLWFPRSVNPNYYDMVMRACLDGGLKPRVTMEKNHTARLGLVGTGMGFTFIPAVTSSRKPDSVMLLPLEDLQLNISLDFVFHRDNRQAALEEFIQVLMETKRASIPLK